MRASRRAVEWGVWRNERSVWLLALLALASAIQPAVITQISRKFRQLHARCHTSDRIVERDFKSIVIFAQRARWALQRFDRGGDRAPLPPVSLPSAPAPLLFLYCSATLPPFHSTAGCTWGLSIAAQDAVLPLRCGGRGRGGEQPPSGAAAMPSTVAHPGRRAVTEVRGGGPELPSPVSTQVGGLCRARLGCRPRRPPPRGGGSTGMAPLAWSFSSLIFPPPLPPPSPPLVLSLRQKVESPCLTKRRISAFYWPR